MKLCLLFILGTLTVFLLAACGGAAPTVTPSPTPEPTSRSAPTAAATATPAPTDIPRPGPTHMAIPAAVSDGGTLEVRVTAGRTDAVASGLVTVRNIEVSASADSNAEWSVVTAEPEQFDLVKLEGVEEVLGA